MKSSLATVKRQRFHAWAGRQVRGLFILGLGCRLPPLDGYVAVCLVLTIDIYGKTCLGLDYFLLRLLCVG